MAALKPSFKVKGLTLAKESDISRQVNCVEASQPPDPVSLSLIWFLWPHMPCGILVPPTRAETWVLCTGSTVLATGPPWTSQKQSLLYLSAGNSAPALEGSSSSVDKTNTERGDCLTWTEMRRHFSFPGKCSPEPEESLSLLSPETDLQGM